jgi:hypothetical protein
LGHGGDEDAGESGQGESDENSAWVHG